MNIFLLFSLFIGHDSGLCVAKTPNNIIGYFFTDIYLLNFRLYAGILHGI
ncbi:hypothetical protein BD31_I2106 [Candidatus Nitrosopumilus salaria BD31]|uniref:Uncharacterized protein n=1 Tax=Candidatus Nitrosopumilus salarius BD31 TaxID=859350 RepID=I3D019_9ARCH|nr:hypothetical protein BD31_I2106 [Candidatus Nitrosopumilus salaria BD31]